MKLPSALNEGTDDEFDDLFPGAREVAQAALAVSSLFYAAFAWYYLLFEPAYVRGPLFTVAALTALLFGALFDMVRRWPASRRLPNWLMFAVLLGAWLNASLHLWLSGNPAPVAGIRVVIIVAGIVLWRRSSFLFVILLSMASMAVATALQGLTVSWIYYLTYFCEAIVVAGATFVAKRIILRRDYELRVSERTARLQAEEGLRQARETERELIAARDAANSGNLAKSRFLATMSHELRTPLNAILGFSEMIAKETLGPAPLKYVEYAGIVHQSGAHLLSLINDVLHLSRIEAGKLDLRPEECEVGELIAETVRLACVKQHNDMETVPQVEIAPGLPPLYADRRSAVQMIVNLLSNAMKFTPPGGRIAVRASAGDDGSLAICVSDTGIGIAPEHLQSVLLPFAQLDDTWTKGHGGCGLGLSIVKSLIELHGGSLQLESEPGKGTRATLKFPPHRRASCAA